MATSPTPRRWPEPLIPQESPPGEPVQRRATSDTEVIVELRAWEVDRSLEEAVVRTMGRLEACSELAVPVRTGVDRGLCMTWFTGEYPIRVPDAVGPAVTPRGPRPNR